MNPVEELKYNFLGAPSESMDEGPVEEDEDEDLDDEDEMDDEDETDDEVDDKEELES